MLSKSIASVCFLFYMSVFYAQGPDIEWENSYGGSELDFPHCIIPTSDGGYITAGNTSSNDGNITEFKGLVDVWIIKLNSEGDLQWQRTFGGSGTESIIEITEVNDGYAFGGYTNSEDGDISDFKGNTDFWFLKTDFEGNLLQEKTIGGSGSDRLFDMIQTSDRGFMLVGSSNSDDGDVNTNAGSTDNFLVKLDSEANIEWVSSIGGGRSDNSYSIVQTDDEGYFVSGISQSDDGAVSVDLLGTKVWVYKLDSGGNMLWQNAFNTLDAFIDVTGVQDMDGNYFLASTTNQEDFWLAKLDGGGQLLWEQSYGGNRADKIFNIDLTTDGGYIVGGETDTDDGSVPAAIGERDCFILKLSKEGEIEWEQYFGGTGDDWVTFIKETPDQGFIFSSASASANFDVSENKGIFDFWLVKLEGLTTSTSDIEPEKRVQLYPIPTSGQIYLRNLTLTEKVSYIIYDVNGGFVKSGELIEPKIDVAGFYPGLYVLSYHYENETSSLKFLVK